MLPGQVFPQAHPSLSYEDPPANQFRNTISFHSPAGTGIAECHSSTVTSGSLDLFCNGLARVPRGQAAPQEQVVHAERRAVVSGACRCSSRRSNGGILERGQHGVCCQYSASLEEHRPESLNHGLPCRSFAVELIRRRERLGHRHKVDPLNTCMTNKHDHDQRALAYLSPQHDAAPRHAIRLLVCAMDGAWRARETGSGVCSAVDRVAGTEAGPSTKAAEAMTCMP
jgi:hypothetical protein